MKIIAWKVNEKRQENQDSGKHIILTLSQSFLWDLHKYEPFPRNNNNYQCLSKRLKATHRHTKN